MADGLSEDLVVQEDVVSAGADDVQRPNFVPNIPVSEMDSVDTFNWLMIVASEQSANYRQIAESIINGLDYKGSVDFIQTVEAGLGYLKQLLHKYGAELAKSAQEGGDQFSDPVGSTIGDFRDKLDRLLEEQSEIDRDNLALASEGKPVIKYDRVDEALFRKAIVFGEAFLRGFAEQGASIDLKDLSSRASKMYNMLSTVHFEKFGGPEL